MTDWGLAKLQGQGRWNTWFEGMIGATLEAPKSHWAQKPTTDIYVTKWQTSCDPVYRFRVVVNTTRRPGQKFMMGVVNAYQEVQ